MTARVGLHSSHLIDAAYASAGSILADPASPHGAKIAVVSGASADSSPVDLVVPGTHGRQKILINFRDPTHPLGRP